MKDDNLIQFNTQNEITDVLTQKLREGAQQMLTKALDVEVKLFLDAYSKQLLEDGTKQVVRNGYLPERTISTGIGDVAVQVPRVRDRGDDDIKFTSKLIPPYLRRTKSVETLLPLLYLKGISSNDFSTALEPILGKTTGLSKSNICKLIGVWGEDFNKFQTRTLSGKRYAYWFVDGVYIKARLSHRQCMLVVIGVDMTGKKELVAIRSGVREDEISWTELLLDLKQRGLNNPPQLAIGDGAIGFWKALHKVYDGAVTQQRCWFHKAGNILSKLPKILQSQANKAIQQIWMAPSREDAGIAMEAFVAAYENKYPKAVDCLTKDKDELLAFYDFPAQHWQHLRTTNPIESIFATVKLRTAKTRGNLSPKLAELMTFRLIQSAEKNWIRFRGCEHTAQVIRGVRFKNGELPTPVIAENVKAA